MNTQAAAKAAGLTEEELLRLFYRGLLHPTKNKKGELVWLKKDLPKKTEK